MTQIEALRPWLGGDATTRLLRAGFDTVAKVALTPDGELTRNRWVGPQTIAKVRSVIPCVIVAEPEPEPEEEPEPEPEPEPADEAMLAINEIEALRPSLGNGAANALLRSGYTLVRDVAYADDDDLLALRWFGAVTLRRVREVIPHADRR